MSKSPEKFESKKEEKKIIQGDKKENLETKTIKFEHLLPEYQKQYSSMAENYKKRNLSTQEIIHALKEACVLYGYESDQTLDMKAADFATFLAQEVERFSLELKTKEDDRENQEKSIHEESMEYVLKKSEEIATKGEKSFEDAFLDLICSDGYSGGGLYPGMRKALNERDIKKLIYLAHQDGWL